MAMEERAAATYVIAAQRRAEEAESEMVRLKAKLYDLLIERVDKQC